MDVDDLTSLPELSLPIILNTIKQRFARNCIFTNVSEIVISVNPFQYLESVLGEHLIRQFHVERSQPEIAACSPHLYSLARAAFRGAVGAGPHPPKNQSVLISGESGAGKTEATKLCLRYFASMSAARGPVPVLEAKHAGEEEDSLEHKLMNANPILEALGNAKTLRNDNSSRFGKWVALQLNSKGVIVGGSITKYLLEESRVVSVGAGERNYHIFYQVCKKFGASPSRFHYLASSSECGVDDAQDFETVMDALRSIGMAYEEREILCNVVWGILHLGQLKFGNLGGESTLGESCQKALKLTAEVLAGPSSEDALRKLLLNQVVHAGHETVVTPRTAEQAKTTRDSIAKMLFARLFDYTVWRINGAIQLGQASGEQVATSIGILDIFGFESFEVNSFEQLCINYANEKLQLFFIDYLTTAELALYQSEGLDVAKMPHTFTNNQPCVDLLEKPNGVFSLIGDEVRSRTGNDMEFLSKLYREQAKHPCFEKPRVGGKDVFSVKHYAQMVEYTVHGFIDKNKSKVGEDVITFFTHSQINMVRSMMSLFDSPAAPAHSPANANARRITVTPQRMEIAQSPTVSRVKHASLGHAFKAQLSDLVVSIEATKAHFIRCIKPNSSRDPQVLDEKMVERQLLTSGMVDAVTIRQLGYSDRLSYPLFLKRYGPIVASYFAPLTTKQAWAKVRDAGDQDKVRVILQLLPRSLEKHWQLGHSRVFYRLPVLAELEKTRELIRRNAALAVQRRARGAMARRDCEELRLIWQDLVECVTLKQWDQMPAALETAREVGFSEKQLHQFQTAWQAAKDLRQATQSLLNALTFAFTPSLPPNKWFRDRVTGLEQAAERVKARKLRFNEALSQLVTISEELCEILSSLWSICTTQQMDASAGPKRAKETILSSCREVTAKRSLLCAKLPVLFEQLEMSGTEVEALLSWRETPIESFPEVHSLCVRVDSLDQHFKESVTKLEASIANMLKADAKTIESVLTVLTEKELGIPLEYFPNGLQALREPLVQKLAVFQAEQRAREQAAEELRVREAAAAEAKAAAARLEPTPLPDHVFKPKLAGNRRKPHQIKSFPPESSQSVEDDEASTGIQGKPHQVKCFPPESSRSATLSPVDSVQTDVFDDPLLPPRVPENAEADPGTPLTASPPSIVVESVVASSVPADADTGPISTLLSSISEHVRTSSIILFPLPSEVTSPLDSSQATMTLTSPSESLVPDTSSVSANEPSSLLPTKDGSDSEEEDVQIRNSESLTEFSSLLPVFHGLGARLDRSIIPGPGTLKVVIHSCANLIFFANNFFVSATYCHAKKTDKGTTPRIKKKRTSVIKKGAKVLNWNEPLEFTSRNPSMDWLRIAVKEKESRSKSKCLGEVRFKVAEIALMALQLLGNRAGNSQLHRVWQLRGSIQGEITLTFSFIENYWEKQKLKKAEAKRATNKR